MHTAFMAQALALARTARHTMDVPVGAVVVLDGVVVGRGVNQCVARGNALLHAEVLALQVRACSVRAGQCAGQWRMRSVYVYGFFFGGVSVRAGVLCA
jgi:tRNA(adenine34) deaminase